MSLSSPKNRFRATATFEKAPKGLDCNVISFSAMTLERTKALIQIFCDGAHINAHIEIIQNLKTYPEFDWQKVESYNYNWKLKSPFVK